MKTILDSKSLVFWKQNQNGTNIYVNGGKDIHLFLKDNYLNVFKTIRDELSDKSKNYTSFVKLWHKVCNDECNIVRKSVRELIIHDYEDAQADIEKVGPKARKPFNFPGKAKSVMPATMSFSTQKSKPLTGFVLK